VVVGPAGVAQVGDLHLQVPLVRDHLEHGVQVLALQLRHLLGHARGHLPRVGRATHACVVAVCGEKNSITE